MKRLLLFILLFSFMASDCLKGEAPPPPVPSGGGGSRSSGGSKATLPFLYFGGLAGIAYPPSSIGATSRLNLGGTFQFRISKNLGIGIYYMQSLKQEASGYNVVPYDKTLIKFMVYGGEINYWFKVDRFAFRVGYRMGPSEILIDGVTVNSGKTDPTHFGPVVSTDFFLGKEVSVGLEGNILFFGDIVENSPFIVYYLNGAVKLWF